MLASWAAFGVAFSAAVPIFAAAKAAGIGDAIPVPSVTAVPEQRSIPVNGRYGLYDVDDFVLTDGRCSNCETIPQALWYFRDETIAVPLAGLPIAETARGITAQADIAQWAAARLPGTTNSFPPLIWVGSPVDLHDARLSPDGKRIESSGQVLAFDVVPKIPLNRSYYNEASIAYFAGRALNVRGRIEDGKLTGRMLWPEDFRLDDRAPPTHVDATAESIRGLMRAEPRGGAQSPFLVTTLWERTPGAARHWQDKPVLAAMVNGAQGDDDEAHGGHFALVTGRVGARGAIDDWLANNFYTLDSFSEKGIIAATLPLDDYLGDLNSGQAWYRPSYLLVAVLKQQRIPQHLQSALNRVYNQFYRHQLVYEHATMNCASISVDVLRALGWNVPARGPTSKVLAAVGLPYVAVKERSLDKARQSYAYLSEDQTRLYPAVAFEELGADLLKLARGHPERPLTTFETMLAEDVDALVFLRVPQFPSSRAWGDAPVISAREYLARFPEDKSKAQIVPVPPRPFPDEMRDPDLLPPPRSSSDSAVLVWGLVIVLGIPSLIWWALSRRTRRRRRLEPGI